MRVIAPSRALLPAPIDCAPGKSALVSPVPCQVSVQPPFCREMVRTLLHGHRYDGSRAARELGLAYTPVESTLGRTIEWARDEGLGAS